MVWGEASHLHRPGVSMQALSVDFGVLISLCERNYTPTEHASTTRVETDVTYEVDWILKTCFLTRSLPCFLASLLPSLLPSFLPYLLTYLLTDLPTVQNHLSMCDEY